MPKHSRHVARDTEGNVKKFRETCASMKREPSDMLREMVHAFIEGRLRIITDHVPVTNIYDTETDHY